ncbi:FMN-binding domain-containing protein [Geosporobacter subterraneus DSM 17957]|uniref:FMN-binding domain-containing protein n=1 Tax=Geosporobacter subterraneus DSM 17957 TaxID=1121919 RepID=A0A1M6J3W4_9FIRM|nr:FMN-binding protein [Geosporobacter subterraneus]SHJ41393.1 FMN-binding domain-containing protein [Geosporobacter subterraneus DSM 17957]
MLHILKNLVYILFAVILLAGCSNIKSSEQPETTNQNIHVSTEVSKQPVEEAIEVQEKPKEVEVSPVQPPQQAAPIEPLSNTKGAKEKTDIPKQVSSNVSPQSASPQPKLEVHNGQSPTMKEPVAEPSKDIQPEGQYKNGTYKGSGEGNEGPVKVQVTVVNGYLDQIIVLSHEDTENLAQNAFKHLSKVMIEQQSTDVDVVAGATASSQGFIHAVKNALK